MTRRPTRSALASRLTVQRLESTELPGVVGGRAPYSKVEGDTDEEKAASLVQAMLGSGLAEKM